MPAIASITPILCVRDVAASAAWWRDGIGFEIAFLYGDPPFYGSVLRDGLAVHLRHVGRPNFAEIAAREESLIALTVEVTDADAMFAELTGQGVEIVQPLIDQPWGGREFQVRDPDGNRIGFVAFPA